MVKLEASGVSGVREAACWHPQEHGFPDPPRNLVAGDRRRVLRIDIWLHASVAIGVDEEPADLPDRNRPNAFEPANPALSDLALLWPSSASSLRWMCNTTLGRSLPISIFGG